MNGKGGSKLITFVAKFELIERKIGHLKPRPNSLSRITYITNHTTVTDITS